MARLPRLYAPAVPQYVVQHAADGRILCDDEEDYRRLSVLLAEASREHALALHAYALLPTEIRFLATPPDEHAIGRVMQSIGRRYVPYLNRRTGRAGALWDRRFRSTLVADDFLVAVMRHVEGRPVRIGVAPEAEAWRWSSASHHTGLQAQPMITDHAAYWSLSDTPFERQARYRSLLQGDMDTTVDARIEDAVAHGWAIGAPAKTPGLAGMNRRAEPLPRGRPLKRARVGN